ncbi:hypothetical protein IPL85_02010 [Candidatus Saccharibacteria bacterium]|nr:MAG: hypothetical protein IPL85_02010 [Candidatus Saccharibacteria bacterium]
MKYMWHNKWHKLAWFSFLLFSLALMAVPSLVAAQAVEGAPCGQTGWTYFQGACMSPTDARRTAPAAPAGPTGTTSIRSIGSTCPTGQSLMGDNKTCCPDGSQDDSKKCLYAKYINPIIKILTFTAGIAAIIGIIIGGIQYSASSGDPQKTAAGKGKIIKALYGFIAFLFLYSALQFLSPGGISSNTAPVGGTASAATCGKKFLGLKPWFAYLQDDNFDPDCNINNKFQLLGDGKNSGILPVSLAIADALVRIAGFVAVVFVIMGGIYFITSNGEPDRAKRGRETIFGALIGLVVAIVAAAVVSFIGSKLSAP